MNGYTKLFGSIIHSTIWQEPHATRVLWVTMLAMADQDGVVSATVPGLAHAAHITLTECEQALARFQEPDQYSRSSVAEGRRVSPIDGGRWQLINYLAYRELMSPEDQREKNRARQQAFRDRRNAKRNDVTLRVTRDNGNNDIAEAYTEAYTETKEKAPEGQPAINLAKGLADRLNMVATQSLLLDMELAIKCAAKKRQTTIAQACDYLLDAAIRARQRGAKVNQFWFRDSDGWEAGNERKSAAQLRNERNRAAVEEALRDLDEVRDGTPKGS